jgi:hypothetical protein
MSNYQPMQDGPAPNYQPHNPYAQPPQPYYAGQPVHGQQPSYAPQQQYAQPPVQQQQYAQPSVYVPPEHSSYSGAGSVPGPPSKGYDSEAAVYSPPPSSGVRFPEVTRCRDAIWAALFLAHVLAMVIMAGVFWNMYSSQLKNSDSGSSSVGEDGEVKLNGHGFEMIGIFILVGLITAMFWLEMFKRFARPLIWVSYEHRTTGRWKDAV